MRLCGTALALVLLVASAPVQAEELVRVDYTTPDGCPDKQAFEAAVAEHLGAPVFARFGELARTLSVTVELASDEFRARVALIDRKGATVDREIAAPTCDQAVRAIALVAALAARAQVEQEDREREKASTARVEPSKPISREPAMADDRPARPAPWPLEGPRPSSRRARVLAFGLSAGTAATTGVGPRVAPGLLVAFRAALAGATERSLVLSALGYDTFRSSLDVADVRFRLLKARLEICPAEPHLSEQLLFSPCAGFELGSQTGQSYADGVRVGTPRRVSGLWSAATLAARVRWNPDRFVLALGPEVGFPVERNGYALTRPDRPVYRVPSVTLGFSAALGLVWN
jgi:hypothetical protein